MGRVGKLPIPKFASNMQLTPQEKIKECIQHARDYFGVESPNILIEYNFDRVEEEWFEGFDFQLNEKVTKDTAKYIYKMQ